MERNFRKIEMPPEIRVVPGFTIQAQMKNTITMTPKYCGVHVPRHPKPSMFRSYYEQRMLPIAVDYHSSWRKIRWLADIKKLDFIYYLPLFFTGLTETTHPYDFLSFQGSVDLLKNAGNDLLRVLPAIIQHLKNALRTRVPIIMGKACRIIQIMATQSPLLGLALVRYYSDLLPMLRLFKDRNPVNLGDGIEYSQNRGLNLRDTIIETLEVLERTGGEKAFYQIRYLVPTYSSIIHN